MTVDRIDYIVRVSFTTPPGGDGSSLEGRAEETMAGLMKEVAAACDEAEIVHRRVFEPPRAAPPPDAPIQFSCARCKRPRASLPGRLCAACWRLTR
jgi:hypothetical protein